MWKGAACKLPTIDSIIIALGALHVKMSPADIYRNANGPFCKLTLYIFRAIFLFSHFND